MAMRAEEVDIEAERHGGDESAAMRRMRRIPALGAVLLSSLPDHGMARDPPGADWKALQVFG